MLCSSWWGSPQQLSEERGTLGESKREKRDEDQKSK